MRRPGRDESPDRLYTVTGGRSRSHSEAFDLVTLVVSEAEPASGTQSEHVAILRLCRAPTAVVEIAAELRMPVSIVKILLSDLLDSGRITVRHPNLTSTATATAPGRPPAPTAVQPTPEQPTAPAAEHPGDGAPAATRRSAVPPAQLPDPTILEQVLVGLRNL